MRCAFAISVAVFIAVPSAFALDLPTRKPGLWEIKMTFEGRNLPPQVAQHCIDTESDRLMNATGTTTQKEACSKQDIRRVGDTIVSDSVCKFGEMTTTSHGIITGDFNSAYTVKVESKRDGGPAVPGVQPGAATHMLVEAKWLGACKADQRPGDVIMQNGMKLNVLDMQKKNGASQPGAQPRR